MSISLLYGCCQIETCTSDLATAREFLRRTLHAEPIEQPLARQIAELMQGTGYDVDHFDCGGAVFQINQPARGMTFKGQPSIHQAYLDERGPCVTNLNYYVDDIYHAHDLLLAMGTPIHIEGPSSIAATLGDYGPDNTREDGAERPFLFMGTRHLIGFDLEIMEPNFKRFSFQTTQWPAFIEPRPVAASAFRLHRLVVGVEDLHATYDAVRRIFAPASRSKPYHVTPESFRIGLGGMEIEYRLLNGWRPVGVTAIAFGSSSPGNADPTLADAQDIVGFDVIIEPREPEPGQKL